MLLAAALGTLVLVAFTARRLGRSPQAAVALVGLNPLVLVYGIGGAHNEPLVLLCSVAAVSLAVVGWQRGDAPWWDVGAGACAVLAAGFKPSAALLAPVVVLACRRRLPALGGAGSAGALVLAVVGLVYGGHLPATSIQDGLVGPLSVPNVLAALAGHGGLTPHDRVIAHAVLALAAVGATAAVAWRRAWLPGAAGFVMLATVLTLGWTMPWYVWWVLPFAALARTRALAGACVVLTAWLALGAIPQMPKVIHSLRLLPDAHGGGARQPPLHPALSAMSRPPRRRPRVPPWSSSSCASASSAPPTRRSRSPPTPCCVALDAPGAARGRRRLGRRRGQRLPPQPRLDLPRRRARRRPGGALRRRPAHGLGAQRGPGGDRGRR